MPFRPLASTSLGILETTGWTPAMVAIDTMEKAARIDVWQAELNDFLGACIKITGSLDAVRTAIDAGHGVARQMGGNPRSTVIPRTTAAAQTGIDSVVEFNPLIEQFVVHLPHHPLGHERNSPMADLPVPALGFIETQGFTAVIEAIDTACKAASVQVVGKEKLGGGYVTIVIQGDVAAVRAAIDAARPKVDGLGKLIAAHVIPRPSPGVLSLIPATPKTA